jgi:hypothetical protein
MYIMFPEEEFEDTKVIIRIRKSKKDRQHDGQKKKKNIVVTHSGVQFLFCFSSFCETCIASFSTLSIAPSVFSNVYFLVYYKLYK